MTFGYWSLMAGFLLLSFTLNFAFGNGPAAMLAALVGPSAILLMPVGALMSHIHRKESERAARCFEGEKLVTHWSYDIAEWRAYTSRRYRKASWATFGATLAFVL